MNNEKRPAETAADSSTEAQVPTSTPTCSNTHVGCCTIAMAKNFLRLVGIFLLLFILTMLVLPINRYWAFVGVVYLVLAICLQLFWNKYFKPLFENDAVKV